jgi:hypothetical protein
MPIFGRRRLRSILAQYKACYNGRRPIAAASSTRPGPTTLPPTSPRSGSSADPSSAALSTNTSGPHRSHGQDRWPSSGPHRMVLQRSGSVVRSRVLRACSTRRFSGSLSLRVSRSSAKGSTSSGSPARMARSQRHRRRLNIRPVRPAPATTAYGLVQAWDRQRTTSWRQPDGLLSPDGHTRHRRPRRDRCPKPAQAHRIAGVEVLRASTLPRKSCR